MSESWRRFGGEYRPSYVGISNSDKQRFLTKYAEAIPVEGPLETPCLRWTYSSSSRGYGHMRCEGKLLVATRIAWFVFKGDIPDGLWILHRCDNPWCVNIDHLFLGTPSDNNLDCIAKGRHVDMVGEDNGNNKLTADKVLQVYRLAWSGRYTQPQIAEMFGTTKENVSAIKKRENWKSLLAEEPEYGEVVSNFKLTEDQALQVHELAWSGRYHQRDIARRFGVTQTQVSRIKNGVNWKQLRSASGEQV